MCHHIENTNMGSKKEEVPMTNMEKLKYGCFVALGWDHVLCEFAKNCKISDSFEIGFKEEL